MLLLCSKDKLAIIRIFMASNYWESTVYIYNTTGSFYSSTIVELTFFCNFNIKGKPWLMIRSSFVFIICSLIDQFQLLLRKGFDNYELKTHACMQTYNMWTFLLSTIGSFKGKNAIGYHKLTYVKKSFKWERLFGIISKNWKKLEKLHILKLKCITCLFFYPDFIQMKFELFFFPIELSIEKENRWQ